MEPVAPLLRPVAPAPAPALPASLPPSIAPSLSSSYLFPPVPSPQTPHPECYALSSSLRVFANRDAVFTYIDKELTSWRLDPYLLIYKKAQKAAEKALANGRQTQRGFQNRFSNLHSGRAGSLDSGVVQGYAEATCAYSAATESYLRVAQIQLSIISPDDVSARLHATEAAQHTLAYGQENTARLQQTRRYAHNSRNSLPDSDDENIQAAVNSAHAATLKAEAAYAKVQEAAVLAQAACDQAQFALAKKYVLSAKRYADSAKAYAKCAQRHAKTAHAHHQALQTPTEQNRQSAVNFQASAQSLQKYAHSVEKRAARLLAKAVAAENNPDILEPQDEVNGHLRVALRYVSHAARRTMQEMRSVHKYACTQIKRGAQPLIRRLPFESAVKESSFQFFRRHLPHLTSIINRLACFFFTAPLSAVDLYIHAFWCVTKLSLLALRGTIYTLSLGHYDLPLQDHVSIEHVSYHAKKVALFTINMFFGPLLGLVAPSVLIKQQTRYQLTGKCNEFELV